MAATATIEVLAEPNRRQLLDVLRTGERSVNALVATVQLSQPAVSKHLRVLRDAGLVDVRPDGQRRLYRLRPEPLMELDEWLEPYREMWRTSLDKLERHLAVTEPPAADAPRRRPRPRPQTKRKNR